MMFPKAGLSPLWDALVENVYAWTLVGMTPNASGDNDSTRNGLRGEEARR
jgi:hypothetical protein